MWGVLEFSVNFVSCTVIMSMSCFLIVISISLVLFVSPFMFVCSIFSVFRLSMFWVGFVGGELSCRGLCGV